jgi:hypothetical protein
MGEGPASSFPVARHPEERSDEARFSVACFSSDEFSLRAQFAATGRQ